jgi:predicted ABC-type ATPase
MRRAAASRPRTPWIVVLGGPNGAGKTTSALSLLPAELNVGHFVNADMIASGLSPFDPAAAALRAGRHMIERIRELAARSESLAFETTLASRSFAPFLAAQRARGYSIHVVYVWLQDADIAVARVRARVAAGGHGIPEVDIRRRYVRGLTNFLELYAPMADSWTLCDNSGASLLLVAQGWRGRQVVISDPGVYSQIQRSVERWPLKCRKA